MPGPISKFFCVYIYCQPFLIRQIYINKIRIIGRGGGFDDRWVVFTWYNICSGMTDGVAFRSFLTIDKPVLIEGCVYMGGYTLFRYAMFVYTSWIITFLWHLFAVIQLISGKTNTLHMFPFGNNWDFFSVWFYFSIYGLK